MVLGALATTMAKENITASATVAVRLKATEIVHMNLHLLCSTGNTFLPFCPLTELYYFK